MGPCRQCSIPGKMGKLSDTDKYVNRVPEFCQYVIRSTICLGDEDFQSFVNMLTACQSFVNRFRLRSTICLGDEDFQSFFFRAEPENIFNRTTLLTGGWGYIYIYIIYIYIYIYIFVFFTLRARKPINRDMMRLSSTAAELVVNVSFVSLRLF